jgi:hypothetical protein
LENLADDLAHWPEESLSQASVEQLRQWRVEAQRRLDRAESELEEATQLASVYGTAYDQLGRKAMEIEADNEAEARRLQAVAEENGKKADEKTRAAKAAEKVMQNEVDLIKALKIHIRQHGAG